MKKKFKDTKVGKILTGPLFRNIIGLVPAVGKPIADTLEDTLSSPTGTLNNNQKKEWWMEIKGIIKVIIAGVIIYLLLTGKISQEDAEGAQEILNNSQ